MSPYKKKYKKIVIIIKREGNAAMVISLLLDNGLDHFPHYTAEGSYGHHIKSYINSGNEIYKCSEVRGHKETASSDNEK